MDLSLVTSAPAKNGYLSGRLGHILDQSEMLIKVSCLHREHVLLVARCVTYVGGHKAIMQLIIADWQKTYIHWLRIGGLGHNTNPLASGKSARTAEGDGRVEKVLNLRIAVINDLPNLAF